MILEIVFAAGCFWGVEKKIGDFFKPCPSRAKTGFKKSPSG
jgi:peptide methionine sulfoxide reductase MsrA